MEAYSCVDTIDKVLWGVLCYFVGIIFGVLLPKEKPVDTCQ